MGNKASSSNGTAIHNASLSGTVGNAGLINYALSTTEIPVVNPTGFPFDYEGEDPDFSDPTEDSHDDYETWLLNKTAYIEEAHTKIFRGQNAERGEIPHQVSLRNVIGGGNAHFCGASIIHSVLLLTAAHCLTAKNLRPEQIRVVAGEHNLDVIDEGEQIRNVRKIIIHNGWNSITLDNDIAILVLDKPLIFDNYTSPIELAKGGEMRYETANVSGWGITSHTDRYASREHQVAEIRFAVWEGCRRYYSEKLNKTLTKNMLCAGGKKRNACKGDSGGPLTCKKTQDDTIYLCGIVSFGSKCGLSHSPGVYTDVSKYYQWIRKYVRIAEQRYQGARIQGGNAASGEFPYHASVQLRRTNLHIMEGSVVHPLLVLTVAHQTRRFRAGELKVVTGKPSLMDEEGTEQWRNAPLRFDNYTRPIKILDGNVDRKQGAFVSGWGVGGWVDRSPFDIIQGVPVNIESHCSSKWEQYGRIITNNGICATAVTRTEFNLSGPTYCTGTGSGDPLVCERSSSSRADHYLCGISSQNLLSCLDKGIYQLPDVYTDVSKYYQWIMSHMQTLRQ